MTPALALDGLHGDVVAKQRMAAVINEHIRDFVKEPMALPENQTEVIKTLIHRFRSTMQTVYYIRCGT